MRIEISETWQPKASTFGSRTIRLEVGPEDFPELAEPSREAIDKVEKFLQMEVARYRYKVGNLSDKELEEVVSYVKRW